MIDYDVNENDSESDGCCDCLKFDRRPRGYHMVPHMGIVAEKFQEQLDSLRQLMGDRQLPLDQ